MPNSINIKNLKQYFPFKDSPKPLLTAPFGHEYKNYMDWNSMHEHITWFHVFFNEIFHGKVYMSSLQTLKNGLIMVDFPTQEWSERLPTTAEAALY